MAASKKDEKQMEVEETTKDDMLFKIFDTETFPNNFENVFPDDSSKLMNGENGLLFSEDLFDVNSSLNYNEDVQDRLKDAAEQKTNIDFEDSFDDKQTTDSEEIADAEEDKSVETGSEDSENVSVSFSMKLTDDTEQSKHDTEISVTAAETVPKVVTAKTSILDYLEKVEVKPKISGEHPFVRNLLPLKENENENASNGDLANVFDKIDEHIESKLTSQNKPTEDDSSSLSLSLAAEENGAIDAKVTEIKPETNENDKLNCVQSLEKTDSVSKPSPKSVPKARKSGQPCSKTLSSYCVKTVNLAPIANIRVKLPVIGKGFNLHERSVVDIQNCRIKLESDKKDLTERALLESEKLKAKAGRHRKRKFGTYDLPSKKRKKNARKRDENDEDDDDSRSEEEKPDKSKGEETPKNSLEKQNPILKNSATILELLSKQPSVFKTNAMVYPPRKNKLMLNKRQNKMGHVGKTVAELLRESHVKQLAAKELRNSSVPHESGTGESDFALEPSPLDDTEKENSGTTLDELRDDDAKSSSSSGISEFGTTGKKKLDPTIVYPTGIPTAGLRSILPKSGVGVPSSSVYNNSPRPASGSGMKMSLLSQMVAAAPKLLPGGHSSTQVFNVSRSLLNGVSMPVTPPKTPDNQGTTAEAGVNCAMQQSATGLPEREIIPLCCCKINGAAFNKLSSSMTYCQALDSIDGKVMGCCNKVTNSQLVRPAVKIPFMAVCELHRTRLKQHQCCPGCGHFCTQGRFYQCRKEGGSVIHNFHKQCQVFKDGKYYCPHCGEESSQFEVNLTLNEPRIMSGFDEKVERNISFMSTAKMAIHANTYKSQGIEQDFIYVPQTFSLECRSKTLSSEGLPTGSERSNLEKILFTLQQERPKKYRTLPKYLYIPAKEGDLTRVIYMLADGVDPNQKFEECDNQTSLHAAAINGNLTLVHLLVQAGACVDVLDEKLNTPLMYASENNHLDVIKYLVETGAYVNLKGEDGMTCLHNAAKEGHLDVMKYLLKTKKIHVNVQDDGGWTSIVWAVENKLVDAVKFLISYGGDPNVKDNEENTGLHWAAFSGSVEIAELFLNEGCQLEAANEHGDRPLHIAARQDHYECVVLFLARGADVEGKNNESQVPISCCLNQNSQVWMALRVNKQLKGFASKRLQRPEKMIHRDISCGRETIPIPVINGVDDEGPPLDFQYLTKNVETTPLNINMVISSLQSCRCKDNCSSTFCVCTRNSVMCWYDQEGHLVKDFNQVEPPFIFECNRGCRCWTSCNNRVVQNGIVCRIQLFKTNGRGWGVRTLQDIPQGTFICEYIGELISDSEADRREDDSYLFDLDNKDGETYCIDARKYGNISRFINHLCEPNVIPVKAFVDHQDLRFPRICFFSSRDIKAMEELGFDYGEKFWVIKWKQFTCACGSPKCKYSKETIHSTLEEYRRRHEDDEVVQES